MVFEIFETIFQLSVWNGVINRVQIILAFEFKVQAQRFSNLDIFEHFKWETWLTKLYRKLLIISFRITIWLPVAGSPIKWLGTYESIDEQ